MAPGTVYGRIPNGENQECTMFFIEINSKGMKVDDDEGRRLNDDNNYFNMDHFSNITSTMGLASNCSFEKIVDENVLFVFVYTFN